MKKLENADSRPFLPGHTKHIAMMAVCCGLPILLLLLVGISVYGITAQSLETLILLICPVGMGAMMWMMMRSEKPGSSETAKTEELAPISTNTELPSKR